jgi:hypothetical protein
VITPGQRDSDRLVEVPDPAPEAGEVLVQVLAVGVDGTDDELTSGQYGEALEGEDQLVSVKAFEQVEVIQRRLTWQPQRALVTGAGPIGLLAAAVLALRGAGRRRVQPVRVRPGGPDTVVVFAHPVVPRMPAARACASCAGPPSPAHRPQPQLGQEWGTQRARACPGGEAAPAAGHLPPEPDS